MLLRSHRQVAWIRQENEGTQGVRVKTLFSRSEGAVRLAMQIFELEPGGHTPFHAYVWEHEAYVMEGRGTVRGPEGDLSVEAGDAVYIPAGEPHQFLAGEEGFRFLCAVPILKEEATAGASRPDSLQGRAGARAVYGDPEP